MVEQSTAASHALAREAEELARLISRFQVGDSGVRADQHRPAVSASPRAPTPSAAAPAYSRAATARKLEPEAQAQDEGWEEF
jgi:methyl-accepting chemotaxis protein